MNSTLATLMVAADAKEQGDLSKAISRFRRSLDGLATITG